jgi:hypothetical protein
MVVSMKQKIEVLERLNKDETMQKVAEVLAMLHLATGRGKETIEKFCYAEASNEVPKEGKKERKKECGYEKGE